jgi:hypothetical protein
MGSVLLLLKQLGLCRRALLCLDQQGVVVTYLEPASSDTIGQDPDGGLDDFSSYHITGVNLLLADGSVHFFQNITGDGQVRLDFWAMGTRAGGEVIQLLDY